MKPIFKMRFRSLLLLVLLDTLLVACGGGSGSSSPPNTSSDGTNGQSDAISYYGQLVIEIYDRGSQYGASLIGNFYRYTGNLDKLVQNVQEPLFEDQCSVFGFDTDDDNDGTTSGESPFENIDAGEVIVYSGSSGTVAELPKSQFGGSNTYYTDVPISSVNAITVADIPGSEFPTFGNATVPEIELLALTSPSSSESFDIDTEFRWAPSAFDDDELVITGTSQSDSGDAFGYHCSVMDDGSFVVPADIASTLGTSFQITNLFVGRGRTSVEQRGNVAVSIYTRDSLFF